MSEFPGLILEYPWWSSFLRGPGAAFSENSVCQDEELAHDGSEGKFCGLTGCDELRVFCFQIWVEACGDEGWHLESLADAGPSAADEGAADPASGLARDRSKSAKACGLAGFEGSSFGHFNQQSEGGEFGDAGDGSQDREAFGELRISFDEGKNGRVDGGDLTFDLSEALRILPLQQRKRQDFGAVLGGRTILHQGFAGNMKLLEYPAFLK
jgi:hypothetical protein